MSARSLPLLVLVLANCTSSTSGPSGPSTPTSVASSDGSPRDASESLFREAERKREAAERIRLPAFQGTLAREDVLQFTKTTVADWVKRRRQACEEADQAYLRVQNTSSSPAWQVAAARRRGDLWSSFAGEFVLPTPAEFEQDREKRAAYQEAMGEAMEPTRQRARQRYEECVSLAQKTGLQDEHVRRCQQQAQAPARTP